MEIRTFPGSLCDSVEVTEAGSLAGFLHEGTKLELLPGQKTYMLQEKDIKSQYSERHRGLKCVYVSTGDLSDVFHPSNVRDLLLFESVQTSNQAVTVCFLLKCIKPQPKE